VLKNNKTAFVLKYAVLVITAFVTLYPLLWVLLNSFKTNVELFTSPWGTPKEWHPENYKNAWITANINVYFFNSVIVSVASLFFSLLLSTTVSFAITRLKFKLSIVVFGVFTVGMMIPVHATLIPIFLMFSRIRLTNSLYSLIIPYTAFSLPIAVMIFTGFFKTFPRELEEAAVIDGSTIKGMFVRVTLPMCKPCIATVAIYNFLGMWNELNYALVLIRSRSKMTLPIGMTGFKEQFTTDYVGIFAAVIITIIPTIIIYIAFNKQIIEGMTIGALKG
jgi:raffinose/stachyose/melibiose transport system permease protein